MDMFKVLSRSTKLRKAGPTSSSQSVPSSGQTANPQIFGRDEHRDSFPNGKSLLGKRKRNDDRVLPVPGALDFFAEKRSKKQEKTTGGGNAESRQRLEEEQDRSVLGDSHDTLDGIHAEEMALDARKRILKSHKIKINLLTSTNGQHRSVTAERLKKEKEKTSVYPAPLDSFKQVFSLFAINRRLALNIQEQGYTTPTEVQLAALPLLLGESPLDLEGYDMALEWPLNLLAVAPTGSGKTLAFLIPIINDLLKRRKKDENSPYQGPTAVILAPTKELANQIVNEGKKLATGTRLRIAMMRKDMTFANAGLNGAADKQSNEFDRRNDLHSDDDASDEEITNSKKAKGRTTRTAPKSDIIVSTPLSLVHALGSGQQRKRLPFVCYLVLDEADVLLDPLFREQTMAIWSACTNPQLSVSLWSATMASTIESLALEKIASTGSDNSILRLVVGIKDTALHTIKHDLIYAATETGKLLSMRQLLHPTSSTTDSEGRKAVRPPFLVFTQTIPRAIALQSELKYDIPPEAGGSSRIAVLHSGLSDTARSRVMTGFRRGEIWVIITTDLLARGVDFRGLNGVVNYDVPTSAAAYVHRVGRTGRAGREGGVAVTFYTKDDIPHIKAIANVIAASEKLRSKDGSENTSSVQQWLLDALPTPSKREKKELKRKGVESRRIGVKGERISTKSSYDRRRENMLKASRTTKPPKQVQDAEVSEFEGFD